MNNKEKTLEKALMFKKIVSMKKNQDFKTSTISKGFKKKTGQRRER